MRALSKLRSFGRNVLHKPKVERELSEELSSYLELLTDRKRQEGMDERQARRSALLELEGMEQVKERVRETRSGYRAGLFLQDLRYAFRTLRKTPVFSLTVVSVLALAIGSTTMMFAIVNAVLLKGPPFPDSARLFTLWQRIPQEPRVSFSPKEFSALQKQIQAFESLAFATGNGFTISGRGDPELIIGRLVPPSFFQVLRTNAQLGRTFIDSDANQPVVLLSYALWRDKLGSRSDALGQTLVLNGEPHTIIGVLPKWFDFEGREAKLFIPANLSNPIFAQHLDAHFLRVIGRLKTGISPHQLDAEITRIGPQLDDPEESGQRRYFSLSLKELTIGELRTPLLILLSAVVFLLLVACANVANLTLARINARQTEIALRAALGASRGRLASQLLTESALLALAGALLGIGIATWGLDTLFAYVGDTIPELLRAQVNGWSLLFAFIISASSVILFGVGPAFTGARTNSQAALKGSSRTTTSDRTRQLLVFAEVAIAAVLLICCALMLRSFAALTHVNPGFRPAGVVTAEFGLAKERYPTSAEILQFYRKALPTVRGLRGAEAVGIVTHLPFGGNAWGNGFDIEGYTAPRIGNGSAQIRPVSPGYFSALGIPLKEGRDFNDNDRENAPGVAIVNEQFAKRFWPNESPLGKRIRYSDDWLSIIGVCGNIKHSRLDAESDMEIYASYPQVPAAIMNFVGRDLNFVIRSGSPENLSLDLRRVFRALDPNAVVKINTMEALIRESTAQPRFRTWLIAIFAGFAALLACLGIYGVIAYLVMQRYREIGIRMALGATSVRILKLILGRTLRLAVAGIVLGVMLAFLLSKFLASLLFGVTTHDPVSFVAVPLALVVLALLAGYFPANRAAHVDPVTSLRYE